MNKIANRKFSLATFVKQPSFHDETISDLDGPRYEKWAWKKPMMKSDYKSATILIMCAKFQLNTRMLKHTSRY
jgi:hypothetical protein